MKKQALPFRFLLFFTGLQACSSPVVFHEVRDLTGNGMLVTDSMTTKLTFDISTEYFPTVDIAESVRLIPLEFSGQNKLEAVDKIVVHDSGFYLLDRYESKALYRFDPSGHFIGSIGKLGKTPGDYIEPTDFVVTDSGIIVLDEFAHRLLLYDFSGAWRRSFSPNCRLRRIEMLPGDTLLAAKCGDNRHLADLSSYELVLLNPNTGTVVDKAICNPFRINYDGGSFWSTRDRLLYSQSITGSVFEIEPSGITERYRLRVRESGSQLPESFEEESKGDFEEFCYLYQGNCPYISSSCWETERYLGFRASCKDPISVIVLYDKKEKRVVSGRPAIHMGPETGAFDITAFGLFTVDRFFPAGENRVVGAVSAEYAIGFAKQIAPWIDPTCVPFCKEGNPVLYLLQTQL